MSDNTDPAPDQPDPAPAVPSVEAQIDAHFAQLELLGKTATGRAVDTVKTTIGAFRTFWPAALTAAAALVAVLGFASGRAVDVAIPIALYAVAATGYAVWHCAGRPSLGELAERYADRRYRRDTEDTTALATVIDITKGK